jgi:hypothetical protein
MGIATINQTNLINGIRVLANPLRINPAVGGGIAAFFPFF